MRIYGGKQLILGRGVVIGDYCWLACTSSFGIRLGDHVTIREFGWLQCSSSLFNRLGHGLTVGANTYIGPRSYIGVSGPIVIGSGCDIGGGFTVLAENHAVPDRMRTIREAGTEARGISIGNDCWIGNNVTILDGVSVGEGTVIGAGAVVTKSLPDFSVAYGVPAKLSRVRN